MLNASLRSADNKLQAAPSRIIIDKVQPSVNQGAYPIKKCLQDHVEVNATVLCDGHDELFVQLEYWHESYGNNRKKLALKHNGNDGWLGKFQVTELGSYYFSIAAWIDRFNSWRKKVIKKLAADQLEASDILEGIAQLELYKSDFDKASASALYTDIINFLKEYIDQPVLSTELLQHLESPSLIDVTQHIIDKASYQKSKDYRVTVEVPIAGFSSWYEFFPRSVSFGEKRHGTLKDATRYLDYIASLGFNVVYLPPIHPIGETFRKGKNNSPVSVAGDVGSPWAIGSKDGGHKAIHPELGTFEDFAAFVQRAEELGLHVALDIAFQCSPDHPYVQEHPDWFYQRPDGTIHYAENPPKKYQDIYPINFESPDWKNLWIELKDIFIFWCQHGIKIFRVDNPHTKSFPFWSWAIQEIRREYPDTVFLSEAFTRPHRMYWLAKAGFSQSYTYFTWRHSKAELIEYMNEICRPPISEVFRPNFWPNTPDILASDLRNQDRPAFIKRLVLAATLSSNYGIYGPAFELCMNQPLDTRTEEYLNSEKYELKYWPATLPPGNLTPVIKRLNQIRASHQAMQRTGNHVFLETDNDDIIAFLKSSPEHLDYLLVVVNLDSHNTRSCHFHLARKLLPMDEGSPIEVHDLLSDESYTWHEERQFVELNPYLMPAHIFHITNVTQPLTDELI